MQIGDLNVWFYEYLAGIRPGKPGFEQIEFRPVLVPQLNFVKASHLSPYGLIKSEWRREGGAVKFEISVPPNSTATLHLPGLPSQEVGSGTHTFTAAAP
jgi:alpha-L-rhamnosidase